MTKISNNIMRAAYLLGVLSILVAVVFALTPSISKPITVTSRGFLVFAATLFLCAIASHFIAEREG